jgi:hypothetical protein
VIAYERTVPRSGSGRIGDALLAKRITLGISLILGLASLCNRWGFLYSVGHANLSWKSSKARDANPTLAVLALSAGLTAAGLPNDELAVQRFTLQLVRQHFVVDEVYAAAQAAVGDTGLVEMVVLIGCYLTVCAQLNAFAIPVPGKGKLAEAKGAT